MVGVNGPRGAGITGTGSIVERRFAELLSTFEALDPKLGAEMSDLLTELLAEYEQITVRRHGWQLQQLLSGEAYRYTNVWEPQFGFAEDYDYEAGCSPDEEILKGVRADSDHMHELDADEGRRRAS